MQPFTNNANEDIEESEGNKYLTLIPNDESKSKPKNCKEIWIKTKDITRSTNSNSDNYDKKHTDIKFNSNSNLPLKKKTRIV